MAGHGGTLCKCGTVKGIKSGGQLTGLNMGENTLKRVLEGWGAVRIQLSRNMVKLWITSFTG